MTAPVAPTDTNNPDHFHKVVDCQWACPAHTPVPEYIRLIADRRYADAYMVNRESNVFPGILGRVCDRPCEPACRRGRIDSDEAPKPVAICRLKRVAADYAGDVTERLPKAPKQKNGKRIALIGGGPASLTVANDLAPLGYEVTVFEKETKCGGAMRTQVPSFRLPATVLDFEIDNILNLGIQRRFGAEVKSLKSVLNEGFDAIFIGTGAPIGRDLDLPGRREAGKAVNVGLEFLASVAFEHRDSVASEVIVIGGGNTAMDCARTARRLGGKQVKIVVPEKRHQMLASPWEIEDADAEGAEIINDMLPKAFIVENGRLTGVEFQPLKQAYDAQKRWAPIPADGPTKIIKASEVILAIGQNTAFPFIERDIGIQFQANDRPVVDAKTFQSTLPKVFFGGDAAFGPKNIIWAVAQGHEAAISIHQYCQGQDVAQRPPRGVNLVSQKMGMHDWTYDNSYAAAARRHVPHAPMEERLAKPRLEVELGYDEKLAMQEAARCLNCDIQTVFTAKACIECDACIDICPIDCLSITPADTMEVIQAKMSAPPRNPGHPPVLSEALPGTGKIMVKDEDLCIHCGLCAERCPTGAWDMQKSVITIPKAGAACSR